MSVRTGSGCPEYLTGQQLQAALRDLLGSDLDRIVSLTVDRLAVEAEVYALDDQGSKFLRAPGEVAIDTIHVPVRWDDA